MTARFDLGFLQVSAAARLVCGDELAALVARHARGDWGDGDAVNNARGVIAGQRIVSLYTVHGVRVRIVTYADRTQTHVEVVGHSDYF